MALATQCPYCHTAFRVANDQLKLHAGLVRCGACQQTFNGIEHLLSPGQATVALVAPPANPVSAAAATEAAPADSRAVAETTTTVTSSAAPAVSVATQANTAHLASASALEFDMGEFELNKQAELEADAEAAAKPDAEVSSSPELALDAEVHDLELEIRSTLMNQEDTDWSINTDPKSESEFVLASAAAITEQARNE
ncbi:MAG: zinc-ribbon domain-containing protein, partial [Burkholderiales bacterium]|nr:zinc-ribbon domain-containing protein [Burkholderiales bacterium]